MPLEINILGKQIPLYGLFCMLGIILSAITACLLAKRKKMEFFDFVLVAIITLIGAWIGAKLLFIIVSWNIVVDIFNNYTIMTALKSILTGGYVFYGGLIGGAIALIVTLIIQKKNLLEWLSIYAIVLPLGHACGRIGCFISGCCYGINYDGPLSYTYHKAMDINTPLNTPLLPIQLVEALLLFVLFGISLLIYLKFSKNSLTIMIYCFTYPLIRFVLEFFRGDKSRGIVWSLSTSQWISIVIILSTTFYLVFYNLNKRKKHTHNN